MASMLASFATSRISAKRVDVMKGAKCGWGLRNSDPLTFTEVDVDGNDLLDFTIDPIVTNSSYRAPKVPLGAFDRNALRNTAGHP